MAAGLLDPLAAPDAERMLYFVQLEASRRAQEARQRREADFVLDMREAAERILGDVLVAELSAKHAANTTKLYNSDVARFVRYCRENGVTALGAAPETVHSFLIETAGDDRLPPVRSIKRLVAAIGDLHRRAQLWNPCDDVLVRATVKWIEARHREEKLPKSNGHLKATEH